MLRLSLRLSLFLFLSFPFVLTGQQTINGTITHGGLQREYILYVPASYTAGTPVPLILNFHGYTSNAFEQMFYGDFRPIADTAGFIIVHPMGTVDLLGNTHFNVGWGTSQVDDLGFAAALIDSLSASYSIDQDRIYTTGMSNGGFMSYYLACEMSDRIAAMASVTGTMNVNQPATCSPTHPVPVMEIHGTADATVPYTGNILFGTTPAAIAYWVNYNHCDPTAVITGIPDTDQADGCTAEHQVYNNGDNGSTVEHFKIIGGEHTWPGSNFGGVGTNQDIDACKEIWRFFSKYDIHGLINTTSTGDIVRADPMQIYPNPAGTYIMIERSTDVPAVYTLTTLMGQPMLLGSIATMKYKLDLTAIPAGMFILKVGQESFKIVRAE
ncbi:MAG: T9SS type A sorting domain-containing protein [Saprospiraceae bacterium]|nr:T9SS type A sorting domain-containing protein [Candidatus Opimibacter iunctus]